MKNKIKNKKKQSLIKFVTKLGGFPVVKMGVRYGQVIQYLKNNSHNFQTINYIYVIDKNGKLKGVFSVRELFFRNENELVSKKMERKIISVSLNQSAQEAAILALKREIKEIPVLDKKGILIGVLQTAALLKIFDQEAAADIFRLGGVIHHERTENLKKESLWFSVRHRLPWLIFGMVGAMLTVGIVDFFEGTLAKNLILASYIPLVIYMSDAVGTQMEALIIRDLAMNGRLKFFKYFFRQFLVVIVLGAILSSLLFLISNFFDGNFSLSLLLSASLFCTILTSVLTGLLIPFLFFKIKLDPADASGPVATILQEIISVAVFFAVAQTFL